MRIVLLFVLVGVLLLFGYLSWMSSTELETPVAATNQDSEVVKPADLSEANPIQGPEDVRPQDDSSTRLFDDSVLFSNPLTRQFSAANLLKDYQENINLAREGNVDSVMVVASVIRACSVVGTYSSEDEFLSSDEVQSGLFSGVYLDAIPPLIAPCSKVNVEKPEDALSSYSWAWDWYRAAAAEGDALAQYYLEKGDSKREVRAELLSRAINERGFAAYYEAAYFHGEFLDRQIDPRNLVGTAWFYTACKHHPECNSDEYLKGASNDLYPRDIELIREAAISIQDRIDQGEEISLMKSITIESLIEDEY